MLRRALRGPRLRPLRRHLPAGVAAAALAARHRPAARQALSAIAGAGWLRTYLVGRRIGRGEMAEHEARLRRLRPDVLQHFYVTCIGSMEAELETYPDYDRRKHEARYAAVAEAAGRLTPRGGTVVDVGCASALVLDRLATSRGTRGVGFDLSPTGIRDRARRPHPPALAQAVVEAVPLRDGVADTVVFSEVIEHLVDPWDGLREVSRLLRPGGILVLTTNNGSEMPVVSPVVDPLLWVERLLGRWWPRLLAFRNLTWSEPVNDPADPLPREAPTYAPHYHFCFAELRDHAADAGLTLLRAGSFEFPAPQSTLAGRLRRLTASHPRLGNAAADALETLVAHSPGLNLMGTHHLLVFRRTGMAARAPRRPFGPSGLVPARPPEPGPRVSFPADDQPPRRPARAPRLPQMQG